ncbi:MAG TPA: hypothetical protein VL171_00145 [Verrucomicrobiae bacterium]|nr:hypothetical protein [Verrucomicrobiae bacterium]
MNEDRLNGNWKQARAKVKEEWGRPTDDGLDAIDSKKDQLINKGQEPSRIARDRAERQFRQIDGIERQERKAV